MHLAFSSAAEFDRNRHPGGGFSRFRQIGPAAILFILIFTIPSTAFGQAVDQSRPQGYVTDAANVLNPADREKLEALCTELDQKAQAQIAVVSTKSLGGRPIEDYSIDLATRLGVGPKGSERGVLILLAVDDHRYRIEVGYGLEGILPDAKTGDIGREAVPLLRQNRYGDAIMLMTRRVADVIAADKGVTLTGAAPQTEPDEGTDTLTPGEIFLIFIGIFFLFSILSRMGRGGGTRYGGGGWVGPMIGGMMGSSMGGYRGGWGGGGFGGGGSGGGGFGGFGGGSFGGGGASGSW